MWGLHPGFFFYAVHKRETDAKLPVNWSRPLASSIFFDSLGMIGTRMARVRRLQLQLHRTGQPNEDFEASLCCHTRRVQLPPRPPPPPRPPKHSIEIAEIVIGGRDSHRTEHLALAV